MGNFGSGKARQGKEGKKGLARKVRKAFFFEKKKQKTFGMAVAPQLDPAATATENTHPLWRRKVQKFFGPFFQKRTACLALPCLALPCLALPCLALPYLALPCLALPYLALPYLTLPCLALRQLDRQPAGLPLRICADEGVRERGAKPRLPPQL